MSCVICLDTNKIDLIITKCGHKFHRKCITKWCNYSRTCPLCRSSISYNLRHKQSNYKLNLNLDVICITIYWCYILLYITYITYVIFIYTNINNHMIEQCMNYIHIIISLIWCIRNTIHENYQYYQPYNILIPNEIPNQNVNQN